jgi:ribokinase
MPRLGVVGGVNMDIHLFDVHRPRYGADYVADRYLAEPGGKGANQARAAAILGAEVTLVARVGNDEFGRLCLEAVRCDGVDTRWVRVDKGEHTGFVVIRLIEGRHHSIVFTPGVNEQLAWGDVEPALTELAACDAIVTQTEIPRQVLSPLCRWSTETGVPLFLDPANPSRVTTSALRIAEVVTPDLAEASELVGHPVDTELASVAAVRELTDRGARRVLLKMAERGALLGDATGIRRIATMPVKAVDETGAGDVFLAALAVRRVSGSGWEEAARFANAASALSVSRDGLALPGTAEVLEALDRISTGSSEVTGYAG